MRNFTHSMVKVSVVIPCYNASEFVRDAVYSVRGQTFPDLELICVNDGSKDNTLAVLQQIKAEWNSAIPLVIVDQSNAGASVARNRGVRMASGEYIQFLDADDFLFPEKISGQYQLAKSHNDPDFIVGSYIRVNEDGQTIARRVYNENSASEIPELLMNTNLGNTCSNLFRRDALLAVNGWEEGLKSSQEYDLMFRLIAGGGRIVFDERVCTRILERKSGSISQSNRGDNWRRYVDLRIRMLNFMHQTYPGRDLTNVYQAIFNGLRSLYKYDPDGAIALWRQHIPSSFHPKSGMAYGALYSLLGMRGAEKITSFIRFDK